MGFRVGIRVRAGGIVLDLARGGGGVVAARAAGARVTVVATAVTAATAATEMWVRCSIPRNAR